jgi:hypothetical protein
MVDLRGSVHLFLGCVPLAGDAPDKKPAAADKKEPALIWAKEVVTDFLNAAGNRNLAAAELLLTDELRKNFKAMNDSAPPEMSLNRTLLLISVIGTQWSISREEIAPDRDEAVFRGSFRDGGGFSVRVTKEKESGKWRVHFCDAWGIKEPEDRSKK